MRRLSRPRKAWYYPSIPQALHRGTSPWPTLAASNSATFSGPAAKSCRRKRSGFQPAGGAAPRACAARSRLEQGRTVSPSVTTVDALARALRLSKAEHAHLKALARDGDRRAFTREIVPPPVRRMIESLAQPAYITGRRWDVLAWNAAAEEIFGFGQLPEQDRNTLLLVLTNKQTRKFYGAGWADVAKSMVAMFRATHDEIGRASCRERV